MKTREEAEARAMELFPVTTINEVNLYYEPLRLAYLRCWEEMQQDKQTCGFCVEKAQQKEALIELTENELTTDEDYKKDKE